MTRDDDERALRARPDGPGETAPADKKPYTTPLLFTYGSIGEVTRTGMATGADWLGRFGGW